MYAYYRSLEIESILFNLTLTFCVDICAFVVRIIYKKFCPPTYLYLSAAQERMLRLL